jgi:RHS repeat-associated protein
VKTANKAVLRVGARYIVPSVIPSAARNLLFLLVLLLPQAASAQVQTGTPPFGSYSGGPDAINNANLNQHWTIPIVNKPGRGTNFFYDLSYDGAVWYPLSSGSTKSWQPVASWGWSSFSNIGSGFTGYVTYLYSVSYCYDGMGHPTGADTNQYGYVYYDPWGAQHPITGNLEVKSGGCAPGGVTTTYNNFPGGATDGSGYGSPTPGGPITTKSGGSLNVPFNTTPPSGPYATSFTDRNGNQINVSSAGVFTDTLGATALTISGSSPTTFAYTPASGTPASYVVHYTTKNIKTNFGCSGITEYTATNVSLVNDVTLPDNSAYTFTYENTPGNTGYVTGRVATVTLPTGGTITYSYSGGSNGITCADGSTATLTRATSGGSWSYAQAKGTGAASTTTITDPAGNATKIQFQGIYETERQIYQGSTSGTLLSTIDTCYNGAGPACTSATVTLPIMQRLVTTTIPSSGSTTLVTKSVSAYNSVGVPTEVDQYAFGSGAAPTTPIRKTLITYASLGNITAFTQQVSVQNGSGTLLAQTNNNYDETTPIGAPTGTPQLTSVTGSRGNLTSIQRCTNLSSCSTSFVKSTMTYDTAGQLLTVKDPLNNQTTFSYTDTFFDDSSSSPTNPPAAHSALGYPTDAFVTTTTPPLSSSAGTITSGYYFYSGAQAVATNQNGKSSYVHFDSAGRLSSTYGPSLPIAGGTGNANPWTSISYTSATQVDTFTDINDSSTTPLSSCPIANSCRQDRVNLDGLGRTIKTTLVSDPEGATSVDTTYDVRGQVFSVSHAYRSTGDVTYGLETPSYDAAGRTIKVLHPDGTSSQTFYGAAVTGTGVNTTQLCSSGTYGLGFPILTVDESTSRKREIWTDGLGHTIEGDEPDGTGALTSYVCYKYDPLGNLLQVVRSGTPSQTRTYAYDALSRVTSITIPERANSGGTNCAVTFTYDNNSNLQTRTAPAPNQNTNCTTGAVTTTYSYDALNRLTSKTYSDTTPAVKYGYDGTALTGCTTTPPTLTDSNPKGRMTSMCDSSGATSWAHDAAGRIVTEKRTILGVTQTISYSYNLDSSIAAITYPSTKQLNYTVSNAQRLLTAKDSAVGGPQYALTASYAAIGALQSVITGQVSGGFTGITESHTYNNSLEYTTTKATSTAGTAMDLSLAYSLTGGDNSSVTTITNNADTGRTQTLTYDPLNRILTAISSATSGVDCWGQKFGPDGLAADDALANFNNLNSGTQTLPTCPFGYGTVTVDANNHINSSSTFAYDASGNMTGDGQSGVTYSFDDENRLYKVTGVTGGPWCYVYDGNGLRVAKKSGAASDCSGGTVTKLYWRSISGDALAETDGTGSTTNAAYNEYVFFGGRRIASRSGTGGIFYSFADQVGSTRTITTGNGPGQTPGQLCYDADFTPYGQEISYTARLQTTACPPSYKFTGYERDSETGLDYAFARYYSSRLARFLSTDPLGGSVGDLQSHNAYSYTSNNPLNRIDPSGMNDCPDLKIGCMPSWECQVGLCLAGAAGVDLFGGSWADFWGGDAQIENNMFLQGAGIINNFDILQIAYDPCLAELLGDCRQPANLDWLGLLNGGGRGGAGSPYRLVLLVDCADDDGRWRDYQVQLANGAQGPVPSLKVAENFSPSNIDLVPSQNWKGDSVGDHIRAGYFAGSSYSYKQSFVSQYNGHPWQPLPVTINGKDYPSLQVDSVNQNGRQIVKVNGELAPMQMSPGKPCPNSQ